MGRSGLDAGRGALAQQRLLARVAGQCRCLQEGRAGFGEAAEFFQQVAVHRREQVVVGQRRRLAQRFHQRQRRGRAFGHRDGDGAIELHHRRGQHVDQLVVQGGDARPVGGRCLGGAGVAGGDGCLQRVGAGAATKFLGAR